MIDSNIVLTGQTIAYTFYVLAIMALMGWFAYKVTRNGSGKEIKPVLFYSFVGFLILIGVSLHIVTHETIPWKAMDLNRAEIKADKEFHITMANHKFQLPSNKLTITKNEKVKFKGEGRHDPCILPRAVPVVEAMAALVIIDSYLFSKI